MAAKQVIIAVAVFAALAGVCRAVEYSNPESYWCYESYMSRVALDGPAELSKDNDNLCKEACKLEEHSNQYLPGNWAIFGKGEQVKCCCAAPKPATGTWRYQVQQPHISLDLEYGRFLQVDELNDYYHGLQHD